MATKQELEQELAALKEQLAQVQKPKDQAVFALCYDMEGNILSVAPIRGNTVVGLQALKIVLANTGFQVDQMLLQAVEREAKAE